MSRIAVVGMACRYPDATSPRELWENALAGRRAFRRLPDVRMRLEDYWDPDPRTPDRFYARNAAVIEGYEFDRIAYKVAGSTYRSTDLTHWLALDVAAMALADAGFPMAEGLPRERTGVVVGNTLTGEFSRANQLRLRWPYVRRMVAAALKEQDWDDDQLSSFLDGFEATFKNPFPEVDEDTLAGGLSNTIAGRICNHFDFKGGGYTVDGACSSSLLSVATACKTLVDGEVDVAVAGGVDLSIDPFEIIGFARTGALATGEMRVYDRGSNGFWPGEGCGMVVLMRESDALRAGHRIYATVAGWGISSDGKGGITRPEVAGYQLALRRAYERAGFGIESVPLFEGHGTGTAVGDATELKALSLARRSADPAASRAAISSIKGMIGHTKAAAGVAGLIKAAMAVHHQVLPPAVGCVDPHELLAEDSAALRALRKAEPWPAGEPVRAGVTAMGFGGINTHIVLDGAPATRQERLDSRTRQLASSAQDVELLLIDGSSPQELRERLGRLLDFVPQVSYAQLADLAATLHAELRHLPHRAAVLASSPEDAERQLRRLCQALDADETELLTADGRCFLGHAGGPRRVGFLFPGQGSGRGTSGGALRRRFAEVDEIYQLADLPSGGSAIATEVAQPRIVTGSLAGLRVLSMLGIKASVAVGHSLGEISALHWAGVLDQSALLRTAALRGSTMSRLSASGTMANIGAAPELVTDLTAGLDVVIAGYNGPEHTVIAGTAADVEEATRRATEKGLSVNPLAVSHAFHSPLVAPAADAFRDALSGQRFGAVGQRVISTVTGEALAEDTDVTALLHRQITDPVLFAQAVTLAAKEVDLFVEVGPGRVLSSLAAASTDVPAVAMNTDDESLTGLLRVVAAAYVLGAAGAGAALFHGRLVRPLKVGQEFSFFASPCEVAPVVDLPAVTRRPAAEPAAADGAAPTGESGVDMLRRLAAERAELPLEMVHGQSRLLDDLHLSSITVGQIVNQAAQLLGVPPAQTPTNFATATVEQLADSLRELAGTGGGGAAEPPPTVEGVADWARAWRIDLDETARPARPEPEVHGHWDLHADPGHALAEPLRAALSRGALGGGILVCLPDRCEERHVLMALRAARSAATAAPGTRFVLVQHGRGAAGLARTLRLEAPRLRTTIVHTPAVPEAVDRVVADVAATVEHSEVYYDDDGRRRVPTLRVMPVRPAAPTAPLDDTDVLLVTGGGKGITAECALALAADSGARLAVLGRSDPAADEELAANLRRMADAGLQVSYQRADVGDAAQVRAAVDRIRADLGEVTAVLHGAGRNEPMAITQVDDAAVRRTFAPKVDGLTAVLAAVRPERLRLLVTFGSIIGRAGLRGEAHYAVANEWLADLTEEFGRDHPDCRVLCLEWSVWSGVGMGEKLSVVESLSREGISPVSVDQGLTLLRRLLADPQAPPTVVVAGRAEGVDTIRRDAPELPLLRFVDRTPVRYHGVELVSEVELTSATDLYLADHRLDGNLLFPAVFGMEAMAQVATALTGGTAPVIEDARFVRPIVVPPDGSTTIRIAALVVDDDRVDVVIRSAETNFAAIHFAATIRFAGEPAPAAAADEQAVAGLPPVALKPAADLYGDTLFQGDRFQRLRRYHRAAARHVDAEVAAVPSTGWFASYLPATLLLGDPGVRDALMHGNQVCVPDGTLLPAAIERLWPAGERLAEAGTLRYRARERSRDGDTYVYDITLHDDAGTVIERWAGLRLRAVRKRDGRGPWVAPLLGPYLERTLGDLLDVSVAVAVEPDPVLAPAPDAPQGEHLRRRRAATALAAGRALGRPVEIGYRPDGRPELPDGAPISAAHDAGLTLCVVGAPGCDVVRVNPRPAHVWASLLGRHADLATAVAETDGESPETAAARVWAAMECLHKAGHTSLAPLGLEPADRAGWTVFSSGDLRVTTLATTLRDLPEPVVFAILTEGRG
ncbi:SDR family NAD(P)-dependent oxidoreductase [Micromonospora chaiyaphumensis]|uniref:Enediyne polyketide synthase n=1 Tax=Micromonospora chaiyaphumensis TaxID=307119 RepID=A0A1C4W0V0_9ACTN|nr:type I polyketide synthase [Micromonospora chaiyaphumensis]SCE89850.1 enediyne polyketide synthase [Micromonospora chaiyaphumensis]